MEICLGIIPDAHKVLSEAVNAACRERGHDFTSAGDNTFTKAFARKIAELVESHGLTATLRSLAVYEHCIEMPCGLSILGSEQLYLPDSSEQDDVDRAVDQTVINAIIEGYMFGGLSIGSFQIEIVEDVYATVPDWEVLQTLPRIRQQIEELEVG